MQIYRLKENVDSDDSDILEECSSSDEAAPVVSKLKKEEKVMVWLFYIDWLWCCIFSFRNMSEKNKPGKVNLGSFFENADCNIVITQVCLCNAHLQNCIFMCFLPFRVLRLKTLTQKVRKQCGNVSFIRRGREVLVYFKLTLKWLRYFPPVGA